MESSSVSWRSDGIVGGAAGAVVAIIQREIREQLADHAQAFGIVVGQKMRDAAGGVMGGRAAQFFFGHVFMGDGLDHVGAGDEHVAGLVDHENEIGERGRIDGSAGAGTHDGGDLRDDAAG